MKTKFRLAFAFIRYKSQNDVAYLGNFWTELFSTLFYVITFVLFVDLLFRNIGALGDFTKNDFLFMTLVGQFTYYVWAIGIYAAMAKLIEDVRTGAFDLTLLRPLSTTLYTYASALRPIYGLFVSIPNIVLISVIIDWSQISISLTSLLLGLVVWCSAMLVLALIMLLLAVPVFSQGDASDMINVSFSLFSLTEIPFNLLPNGIKVMSFVLLPTVVATGATAYVMLCKGDALPIVLASVAIGVVAVILYKAAWNSAMQKYSSASS